MSKKEKQAKHKNRWKLVQYIKSDIPNHVYVEETDVAIKRYRAEDFRLCFKVLDPTAMFAGTIRSKVFGNEHDDNTVEQNRDAQQRQSSENPKAMAMVFKTKRNYQQKIPQRITTTTENPATRGHAMR